MGETANGIGRRNLVPQPPPPLPSLKWGSHKHQRIISRDNRGFPASEFQSKPMTTSPKVKQRMEEEKEKKEKKSGSPSSKVRQRMEEEKEKKEKKEKKSGPPSSKVRQRMEEEKEKKEKKEKKSTDVESEMGVSKLGLDFQFEPLLVVEEEEAQPKTAAAVSFPWNLRSRNGTSVATNMEEEKESKTPVLKLAVTLSNSEIEADLFQMTGKKPPSRPKKRTAAVQRGILPLYVGMSLADIPMERYSVPKSPATMEKVKRKRRI